MSRLHFRQLVTVIALLMIASFTIEFAFPSLIPESVRVADEAYQNDLMSNKSAWSLVFFMVFLIANLIACVASIIGLFFFKRWSLRLNVLLVVLTPLTWFTIGYTVSSWVTMCLMELGSVALGFALAVAWFTPLRDEFN